MKLRFRIFLVPLVLAIHTRADARISAARDAGDLLKIADVILKGEVLSVKDNGPIGHNVQESKDGSEAYARKIGAHEMLAKFRVDRTIRGEIPEKEVNIHFYQVANSGTDGNLIDLKAHEYVILFLRKTARGLQFLDFDHGKMPASKTITSGIKTGLSDREALGDEVLKLANDKDPERVKEGLQYLGELGDTTVISSEAKKHRTSGDFGIRCKSIALLARTGDLPAIQEMVNLLNSEPLSNLVSVYKDDTKHIIDAQRDFMWALDAIRKTKNPALANALLPLLNHKNAGVRRQAVDALRAMKNRETLPQIVKLLDDPDKEVQYDALMTICEIIRPKREGCPSTMLFEANPDKYISEWKDWWTENKTKQ